MLWLIFVANSRAAVKILIALRAESWFFGKAAALRFAKRPGVFKLRQYRI